MSQYTDLVATSEMMMHSHTMVMMPQLWSAFSAGPTPALSWSAFPFKDASRVQIPEVPGVYAFLVAPNIAGNLNVSYLMYIGETERTLRDRFGEYLREAQEDRIRPKLLRIGYVVNVIETPSEREHVLCDAWALSERVLIVAARLDWDIQIDKAVPISDGVLTARGTFQKFFTQHELQTFIEGVLGVQADVAAPGVFYVFRSPEDREAHLSRAIRPYRRIVAAPPPTVAFDHNRDVLEPLHRFMMERGRAPAAGELDCEQQIVQRLGSLNRALRVLSRVVCVRHAIVISHSTAS